MPTTPARGSTHSKVDCEAIHSATIPRWVGDRRLDRRQDPVAGREHAGGHLLVDRRAADQDLLLGGEQRFGELGVAADQPADPQAGKAVRLRHRRDADRPLREAGGDRQRIVEGELAVGLVDQQAGARMGLDDRDQPLQRRELDHRAGRVVGIGDADQLRLRPQPALDQVEVKVPAVLEAQRDRLDLGAERPRRLQVGGVVGLLDQDVVAGLEQRRRDDEQRRRGARGDDHVVDGDGPRGVAGELLAQPRHPAMVPVLQQQVADVGVDPVVGERPVPERALRQVVGDRVVAELLGGFDLDRGAPVPHPCKLFAPAPRSGPGRSSRPRRGPRSGSRTGRCRCGGCTR